MMFFIKTIGRLIKTFIGFFLLPLAMNLIVIGLLFIVSMFGVRSEQDITAWRNVFSVACILLFFVLLLKKKQFVMAISFGAFLAIGFFFGIWINILAFISL
ncbi:MAG: hypothetical protein ABIC95_06950 [archaeon]